MRLKSSIITGILIIFNLVQLKGQEFSITLGQRRGTESFTTEVPMAVVNPDSIGLSTSDLARKFPKAGIIPENIKINYPNLKGAIDTAAIIWYLKPENYTSKGEVNIILVAISADSVKTFYVDNDNNRTFADNEEKFVFDKETEKKDLEIKILGSYNRYTLMNPDYISPFSSPSKIKEYARNWREESKKPSISIDLSVITGGGDVELMVTHQADAFRSYNRFRFVANNHGSLKPEVGFNLSWYNFHLIFTGAYERLQFDDSRKLEYNTPAEDNPRPTFDRTNWPIQKLHAGVTAEYDIRINKFYITPLGSYYVSKNLDKRVFDPYFPNAKFLHFNTIETGIKIKIPIAFKTLMYIKYVYSKTSFDAAGFNLSTNTNVVYDPVSQKFNQNYFGFGFQFRLSGR